MAPYSLDLRQKIVAAHDRGVGSQRVIAELFGVSLSFVERLLRRRRRTGALAPRPHSGGPPRCLDGADEQALRARVEFQPDATLDELVAELAERTGKRASRPTLCRALQRLNLPRKKRLRTPASATPTG